MTIEPLSADQVLSKYWSGKCPVDSIEIANNMGFNIQFADLKENIISIIDGNTLYINCNEIKLRQNFDVAYQIGYYLLSINNSGYSRNIIDTKSLIFARNILIPKEFVNHFIFKKKIANIARLATLFNVPKLIMKQQLIDLNIL